MPGGRKMTFKYLKNKYQLENSQENLRTFHQSQEFMKSYKQYYLDQHKLKEPIKKYQQNNPQGVAKYVIYLVNTRSEEHTSELQSHSDLVCRLLLEKKKKKQL